MSRSGYSDSLDQWPLIMWRGQVASAIRGKRGQAFLRDLAAALDAMPEKRLVAGDFERPDGSVCALGCIAKVRGVSPPKFDEWDDDEPHRREMANALNIAHQLVAEIEFENDEAGQMNESPEWRWVRMRQWVASQILPGVGAEPPEGAP